jgi:hypothetical protein
LPEFGVTRSVTEIESEPATDTHLVEYAETSMRSGPKGDGLVPTAPASRRDASPKLARRNFLFALGVAGTGAAAIAARTFMAPGIAPQGDAVAPSSRDGYALSDHIRRYYRTARI